MTKLAALVAAVHAHDWPTAFRIAARFPRLGPERVAIVRAHEACVRPDFYREVGKDPELLIAEGKAAIFSKYEKELRS
jgi:hypothetical protein